MQHATRTVITKRGEFGKRSAHTCRNPKQVININTTLNRDAGDAWALETAEHIQISHSGCANRIADNLRRQMTARVCLKRRSLCHRSVGPALDDRRTRSLATSTDECSTHSLVCSVSRCMVAAPRADISSQQTISVRGLFSRSRRSPRADDFRARTIFARP